MFGGSSGDKSKQAAAKENVNTTSTVVGAGGPGTNGPDGSATDPSAGGAQDVNASALTNRGRPLPLDVAVSNTSNLRDGSEVSLHVVPKAGSVIYGFEAFLCEGGTTFAGDSDIRPTLAGKCVSKPLSPDSDDYKEVPAAPPYQAADSTFRVGVGTDTYTMRDGKPVTITCGPGHPCQLVLKLQYPNDFGFAAYPLTFG